VLHQVLHVVAEEDLELALELALAEGLDLPEAVWGEDLVVGSLMSQEPWSSLGTTRTEREKNPYL